MEVWTNNWSNWIGGDIESLLYDQYFHINLEHVNFLVFGQNIYNSDPNDWILIKMQQDVVYECRVFLDNIDKYAMAFMLLTNSVTRFFKKGVRRATP